MNNWLINFIKYIIRLINQFPNYQSTHVTHVYNPCLFWSFKVGISLLHKFSKFLLLQKANNHLSGLLWNISPFKHYLILSLYCPIAFLTLVCKLSILFSYGLDSGPLSRTKNSTSLQLIASTLYVTSLSNESNWIIITHI